MAVLVHPQSELIREPGLLVPRMVPIGPVKASQHPLAGSASWAYLLNGATPNRRLFGTKGQAALTLVASATRASSTAGMGWVATTRITGPDTVMMFLTSAGDGTGDFSLMVLADAAASAVGTMLVHTRSPSATYNSVYLVVNAYYADGSNNIITHSSGTVYFGTMLYTAGINTRGIKVDSRVNGRPHCWLGVRRSHIYYLFEDGVLIGTVDHSSNQTDIAISDQQFALGGFTTIDTRAITRPLHFAVEWDFALTNSEAMSLSADPFQLVVPA